MLEHSRWRSKRCTSGPFTPSADTHSKQFEKSEFDSTTCFASKFIQNQPNINPLVATMPDSGQDKNTVESTGKNPKRNGDSDEEEDKLLQDVTQEFEC